MQTRIYRIAWRVSLVALLIAVGCADRKDPERQSPALEAPTPPPAVNPSMTEMPSDANTGSSPNESPEKPNS